MNHQILRSCYLMSVAILCLAPSTLANSTDSMLMTSAGANTMNGIYVGPYYATVGGVANTPIICDDFKDDSWVGQSWTANVNSFSTLGSALWGNQTQKYDQAAWLTLQMLALNSNPANATQVGYISYAIWYLFDAADVTTHLLGSGSAGTQTWVGLQTYLTQVSQQQFTAGQFSNFAVLTPTCTSGPGSCQSQEFLTVVPEGGSTLTYLALAGFACFLAMFLRSRQLRTQ